MGLSLDSQACRDCKQSNALYTACYCLFVQYMSVHYVSVFNCMSVLDLSICTCLFVLSLSVCT